MTNEETLAVSKLLVAYNNLQDAINFYNKTTKGKLITTEGFIDIKDAELKTVSFRMHKYNLEKA